MSRARCAALMETLSRQIRLDMIPVAVDRTLLSFDDTVSAAYNHT